MFQTRIGANRSIYWRREMTCSSFASDCRNQVWQRIVNQPVNRAPIFAAGCFLAGILAPGCDLPERPLLDPVDIRGSEFSGAATEQADQEVLEPPGELVECRWETWDAYFVRGQHVGYNHVIAEPVGDSSSNDIRYVLDNRLYANQGRSRFLQRLLQTSTETGDGRLIGFESVLHVGPAVTRFVGTMKGVNLEIETIRGSSRTLRQVPWQSTFRGLVAVEQSLRTRPMTKKNETRTLKLLLPGQYQLATARLRCSGKASVSLMDGTPAELTEINSEIQLGENNRNYSTIWTDTDGGIVRTFSPALQLDAYRTDQATATSIDGDDLVAVAITVKGNFARPSEAKRVAFKIKPIVATSDSENPIELIPVPGQYVGAADGFFRLLVSRQEESGLKGFTASELAPSDADLQPNYFVDSTTTLVRRFADAIGSSDMVDWEVAEQLTRTAHRLIAEKKEPSGFSRASEVARAGVGDSTEQAILLAALLRARKIPSQLAIGIKFSPGESDRMLYHAWTLAHVGGEWRHLDATDGSVAAADRIALVTTNLSGGNEYNALIPLLDVIGRIEVEVLGAQY